MRCPPATKALIEPSFDQHDFDRALAKPGGLGQRIDHVLQQRFGFGIAQHADALRHDGLCRQGEGGEYGQ